MEVGQSVTPDSQFLYSGSTYRSTFFFFFFLLFLTHSLMWWKSDTENTIWWFTHPYEVKIENTMIWQYSSTQKTYNFSSLHCFSLKTHFTFTNRHSIHCTWKCYFGMVKPIKNRNYMSHWPVLSQSVSLLNKPTQAFFQAWRDMFNESKVHKPCITDKHAPYNRK